MGFASLGGLRWQPILNTRPFTLAAFSMGDLSAYLEHSNRETKKTSKNQINPHKHGNLRASLFGLYLTLICPPQSKWDHKMVPRRPAIHSQNSMDLNSLGNASVAALVVLAMVTGKGCLDSYFTNIF